MSWVRSLKDLQALCVIPFFSTAFLKSDILPTNHIANFGSFYLNNNPIHSTPTSSTTISSAEIGQHSQVCTGLAAKVFLGLVPNKADDIHRDDCVE
jgi:hypothetical protein